jgi:hypothetical protein
LIAFRVRASAPDRCPHGPEATFYFHPPSHAVPRRLGELLSLALGAALVVNRVLLLS